MSMLTSLRFKWKVYIKIKYVHTFHVSVCIATYNK